MSTFTIRVTSSATNTAGTAFGQQPDLGAPSFLDMIVSDSTDPALPNGVYDAYCLNPLIDINLSPTTYSAENYAGNTPASYVPIGFSSLSQNQIDQINWLLAQNLTSDAKYAGQYNFGEVQLAIWKIAGFTDSQIESANLTLFLNDNNRNVVTAADADFLVQQAQAAVASGNGVVPTNAFFTTVIDPAGNVQPLIVQLQSAKLGNYVWQDTNANGVQDAGEAGVDKVIVELYDSTGTVKLATTTTGDDASTAAVEQGYYQFTGLAAGSYQVKFIAPTGQAFTTPDVGSNGQDTVDSDANILTGLSQVVTLAAGESNQTVDAGLVALQPAKISGYVYEDFGNDGVRNAEPAIGGVTITLTGTNDLGQSVSLTTTTNTSGFYEFTGLRPGNYTVTEAPQPGAYLDGKDTAGTSGGNTSVNDVISNIVLVSGADSQNNNFGELVGAQIKGFVYADDNNNGVKDPGEAGLPGVTVTLTGTNDLGQPVTATTTTQADGSYAFLGLRPGTYTVSEPTQPNGYLDGKDTAGPFGAGVAGNDTIQQIVLTQGLISYDNNFGELKPASLSGFVYVDAGNDGVKGAGEAGIQGVTVKLSGTDDLGNLVTATAVTDVNGAYSFNNLRPGSYTVNETQPAGYTDGKDTAGSTGGTVTNDQIAAVVLTPGLSSTNNNFGELPAATASLSGFVYEDNSNDGLKGATEAGIANVTVKLTGTDDLGNAVTATAVTDANGAYSFNGLRAGNYTVTETQPAGYLDGRDTAGSTGGTAGNDVISSITLGTGQASVNNNFGELKPASLSGFVYVDAGNDGVKGAGEAGIQGVTVKLTGTDDLGNPVTATAVTDVNGAYSFGNLRPGSYTVVETQPSGYADGKDTAGTAGGTVTNDQIAAVTLTAGVNSINNNFGELPAATASLSGFVYEDNSNDGLKGATEAGIANVTVKLTGTDDLGNAVTATAVTDANGAYSFNGLRAGTYTVTETQPAGYLDGRDTAGSTGGTAGNDVISSITLGTGQASVNNNFGELKPASLSGFVYVDAGNDGVKGAGEAGIQGVTVKLSGTDDLGNLVTATAVTDVNGAYSFGNLRPGSYTVVETQPSGYADGKDTAGTAGGTVTNDQIAAVTLTAGVNSINNNFGELPAATASLSGFVYEDNSNDGTKGAGEAGIANVTVKLSGTDDLGNAVTATAVTDANGAYSFNGLRAGTYTVTETQPAGYLDGRDTAGSTGGVATNDVIAGIPLATGQASVNNNFGELKPCLLSGFVYHDANNDGSRAGDAAISGVTVKLTGTDDLGNAVTATAVTDVSGFYKFDNLRPGNYTVTETQPAGYLDGKDTAGTVGASVTGNDAIAVKLAAGQSSLENNFGELKPCLLSGFVYQDANNDGSRTGDAAISGVTVKLTGTDDLGNAVTATAVTDVSGFYKFDNLRPGTYTVTETQPAGYVDGKDTAGTVGATVTANDTIQVVLASGQSSLENNFGETKPLAQIGDFVWEDTNANGIQDLGEKGIAGVTVQLKSGTTVVDTQVTDATGHYLFNVAAGTYSVAVTTPTGYVITGKDANGNTSDAADSDIDATGNTGTYTLAAGGQNLTVDAGFYRTASIGDKVWLDNNRDGLQDTNEPGVAGITVKLLDSAGAVVGTQVTDANGNYLFSGLKPGSYAVQFTPLAGYSFTTKDANGNNSDAADSDVDPATGKTIYTVLDSGEVDRTWDAGLLADCRPVTFCFNGNSATDGTDGNVRTYTDALTGVSVTARAFSQDKGTNTWQAAWLGAYGGGLGVTDVSEGSGADSTHTIDNVGKNNYIVLQFSQAVRVDSAFLGYVVGDSDLQAWVGNSTTTITSMSNAVLAGMAFSEVNTTTLTTERSAELNANDYRGNILIIAADTTDTTPEDFFKLQSVTVCAPDQGTPVAKASIGDTVWFDKNANGLQDGTEVGAANVTVNLLSSTGTVLATTTTDASGKYLFSGLNPGDYKIQVVAPTGYAFTKKDANANASDTIDSDVDTATGTTIVTTLTAGENDLSWDAGLTKVGIDVEKYVSGTKTTTSNNSGGEGASCNYWKSAYTWDWGTWSYGWSGTGCKTTDTFNSVFGVNCTGGTRTLYQILCTTGGGIDALQREAVAAYLNACHNGVSYEYTKDQVCAETKYALSCGAYDEVCNAFQRENNLGCDWSTTKTTWSCVTDAALYDADAPPGLEVLTGSAVTFTYIVKNTGDTALKNVVLTDDRIATVTYVSGDTNNNGLLDVTETWTYKATETASAGTIKNTGTVTATDAVGGVATVTDKDDAYYTGKGNDTTTKGSIGDLVWLDTNANGIQDAGECGIAGVKVTLKGAGVDGTFGTYDDITITTTTNSAGNYEFGNLAAGKYQVVFGDGVNAGYYATKQNQGSNRAVDSNIDSTGSTGVITLAAGEHNLTVDAGVYQKASVGDKVWEDKNHNGVQDVGEGGIGGVTVKLMDSTGTTVLATTTTNTAGNYLFSNLDPGSYVLQFDKTNVLYNGVNMNNWKWGVKDVGSNDAIDSDVKGDGVSLVNVTKTDVFTLVSGQNDMTRDATITPIVIDLDGNGIHTTSLSASAGSFDLLGTGSGIKSGWISSTDGFLAVDKNGNGKIDDISELFGGSAKGAGFAALASYDSNHDGVVNAADADFAKLSVWVDANGNHQTDAGELRSLAEAGVSALTVGYTELPFVDAAGNLHLERSTATLAGGDAVSMTDVYFSVSADDAKAAGVALPTLADLLGNDSSLDAVLGGSAPTTTAAVIAPEAEAACGDASETLRRLAALTQAECHAAVAA